MHKLLILSLTVALSAVFIRSLYSQENYDTWEPVYYKTGETPSCYDFKSTYDYKDDAFLRIIVGGGADIAVKLINNSTGKCVRYIYIKSGDTYEIHYIPEGYFYLKIAFGSDWRMTRALGTCFAKFVDNNQYIKGDDVMNFNKQVVPGQGYYVPAFELQLDVRTRDKSNEFNSEDIPEDEFFK